MSVRQSVIDAACSLSGAAMFGWRNALRMCNIELLVLAYHVVSDGHVPHVAHLHGYKNAARFRADVDLLAKHFTPIEPDMLPRILDGTHSLNRPSFLITIDDGLKEVREVIAPILLAKGIPAIFFVNSEFVDNKSMFFRHKASLLIDKISDEQLQRRVQAVTQQYLPDLHPRRAILRVRHHEQGWLDKAAEAVELDFAAFLAEECPYLTAVDLQGLGKEGFTIGAHSKSHPQYGRLSPEAQLEETLDSIEFVRSQFAPTNLFFAFPFHDLDVPLSLFERMKEAGVSASFGTHAFQNGSAHGNIQRLFADEPHERLDRLVAQKCGELMLLRAVGRGTIRRS